MYALILRVALSLLGAVDGVVVDVVVAAAEVEHWPSSILFSPRSPGVVESLHSPLDLIGTLTWASRYLLP